MSTNIQVTDTGAIAEQVLIGGDLAKLSPAQRADYYLRVCESIGVNPYTKPFEFIILNNKLTLYAKRDCTDQLRRINGVSCTITAREKLDDLYIVTAKARDKDHREDESTGVVSLLNLKGEALANALMKAETKAKRRVTLSICGLGWLDESEVDSVPEARRVNVDTTTGEIIDTEPVEQPSEQFTCEDCGNEITGYTSAKGRSYTPADVVRYSMKDYSRKLCRDCGWAEKARREKQATEQSRIHDDTGDAPDADDTTFLTSAG